MPLYRVTTSNGLSWLTDDLPPKTVKNALANFPSRLGYPFVEFSGKLENGDRDTPYAVIIATAHLSSFEELMP